MNSAPSAVRRANAARFASAAARDGLKAKLDGQIEGEVRFDSLSRALYSTDASVYQIEPLGLVLPRTQQDIVRTVRICAEFGCPITARGGGTSQAGQAVGEGLQVDTSKHFNRILEVNLEERWVRVEPGIVLDELNDRLRPHGLRFAPDISTASRATIGGMLANNSSGARSVLYGKTIDHVIEQHVVLADGSVAHLRPVTPDELDRLCAGPGLEAAAYGAVRRLASQHAEEIGRRFPKILRRVGGYNLDLFVRPAGPEVPFNLSNMIVGSEGTLAMIVEAKLRLVPLPSAKAVLLIEFDDLLDALEAAPAILEHRPSAIEVMDKFILDYTRENPALSRLRSEFIAGEPGAVLVVEFHGDEARELPPRLEKLERALSSSGRGARFLRSSNLAEQARIWSLREAALGLSMAMKGDAKSLSFVEDTAVSPEKLRDYIARFLEIVRAHGTVAGVYAHASVGCLHVRPVVNLKTAEGIQRFEAIAGDIADLVLEYGGALSGEHGDGLVRSPLNRRMFGPVLYDAFRTIKYTFDPQGLFNPGKIVDAPPIISNLRYGAGYRTPDPPAWFDYTEHGGFGRAVEMCSGVGACRKKLDGTMCPSYMATREETHTTRGRANTLRLAMNGTLTDNGLADSDVMRALDLCLECRACRTECPVGVDMARYKSEFLAHFWARHGVSLRARALGYAHEWAVWGSRFAPLGNWLASFGPGRRIAQRLVGIDVRRSLPAWSRRTLRDRFQPASAAATTLLFADTFTNYSEPEIGLAAAEVLETSGIPVGLAPNVCCGRTLISQGLLDEARRLAAANTELLAPLAAEGARFVFCEPSCLSAMREDVPALLRGEQQKRAESVAKSCFLFEESFESDLAAGRAQLSTSGGPPALLLHGHCHQKAMGLLAPARALLSRLSGTQVIDPDAGCCGMAGSFGYVREHYDVSRDIAERKLLPAVRGRPAGTPVIASGTSCRHQIADLAGETAVHPAVFLRTLLRPAERGQ